MYKKLGWMVLSAKLYKLNKNVENYKFQKMGIKKTKSKNLIQNS